MNLKFLKYSKKILKSLQKNREIIQNMHKIRYQFTKLIILRFFKMDIEVGNQEKICFILQIIHNKYSLYILKTYFCSF